SKGPTRRARIARRRNFIQFRKPGGCGLGNSALLVGGRHSSLFYHAPAHDRWPKSHPKWLFFNHLRVGFLARQDRAQGGMLSRRNHGREATPAYLAFPGYPPITWGAAASWRGSFPARARIIS